MHRDLTRARRRLEREESASGEFPRAQDDEATRGSHMPPGTPRPTPRPGKDSVLDRIRKEQIAQHMEAAAKAFEAGRYEEAIEHSYRASAVDEHESGPHELRTKAQAALDEQQADRHLADAQSALGRGDIEAADALVAKAMEVRPGHTGIGVLREAVARARNQVALAAVMQRARTALERQDWTGAIRATTEAELYQPGLEEARQIRHRAQSAIEEQAARNGPARSGSATPSNAPAGPSSMAPSTKRRRRPTRRRATAPIRACSRTCAPRSRWRATRRNRRRGAAHRPPR